AAPPWCARDPLLHAEPLPGDARHPRGAEASAPLAAVEDFDLQRLRHARRPVRRLVADVDRVVLAVGPDAPCAEEPAPAADLVLAQFLLPDEAAPLDDEVGAGLLAHAVEVDLVVGAHAGGEGHGGSRHRGGMM